jgi:hypothetical protein
MDVQRFLTFAARDLFLAGRAPSRARSFAPNRLTPADRADEGSWRRSGDQRSLTSSAVPPGQGGLTASCCR